MPAAVCVEGRGTLEVKQVLDCDHSQLGVGFTVMQRIEMLDEM